MSKMKVGVIGGGQLAWMMAQEAKILGVDLIVQTPNNDDPAVSLATNILLAKVDDSEGTKKLASLCDVITFENEFVDLQALSDFSLNTKVNFYPTLKNLIPLLDKYNQRSYLKNINLPIPSFISLDIIKNNHQSPFGFPIVLKAKRHGYDGKRYIYCKKSR